MAKYAYHQKDGNQDRLVRWLEDRGCLYEHIGQPVDGLLAVPTPRGHVTVPVEFKQPRGKLRPSQEAFLAKWKAPVYVLRNEFECQIMLQEVTK